jgi:excinuclease ABC subunit A
MAQPGGCIRVRGARTHNLHNVNVDLPLGRLIVITGPSGSGKSSLAFDTLHAEGQRRYLETLGSDTRALFEQLQRPDVDVIEGLPPTLCVSQHAGAPRPRSTLATVTEIHDHCRLLWARLGVPHCWQCGRPVEKCSVAQIARRTLESEEGRKIYLLAPLVRDEAGDHKEVFAQIRQGGFLRARIDGVLHEIRGDVRLNPRQKHTIEVVVDRLVVRQTLGERLTESLNTALKQGSGRIIVTDADDGDWHDQAYSTVLECPVCSLRLPDPEPGLFSFNNPHGACPRCTGYGKVWELDPARIVPDRGLSLGKVLERLQDVLPEAAFAQLAGQLARRHDMKTPLDRLSPDAVPSLLFGEGGLVPALRELWEKAQEEDDEEVGELPEALAGFVACPECGGARLNKEARAVTFAEKGLHEVTALTVDEAIAFFEGTAQTNKTAGMERVREILVREITHRLRFLQEVGLEYLTLDRPAPTLSGGELQRARLAAHLGGGLLSVCYVLDEPTIGLHPRDTDRLIDALRGLQARGNTVLVVEHDETVMRRADYLVDIGPGAGRDGGRLLASGTLAEVLANPQSVTAPHLQNKHASFSREPAASAGPGPSIVIRGARHHNLKNITVSIPLGKLVCLTGVSGSGKSSLARDILCYAARRHLGLLAPTPGAHDQIDGLDQIDKVIEVDQKRLGRSSRSNPASFTGVYDEIRKIFAATRTAKVRGYKANRFSFNVRGGRCEECQGKGSRRVAQHFLPELTVPCPACNGKRFNRATLEVRYRDRSIADVLSMAVAQARDFFAAIPAVQRVLEALADVGLGYLCLGQPSGTLSGGEAQRVKLAAELAKTATGRTLFLLDEPTTGLHFGDVASLLGVLRRLVERGNTVVVIEHHMDLIAAADWVIDLGPEGGAAGGELVVAGSPADVARCQRSLTGRFVFPS